MPPRSYETVLAHPLVTRPVTEIRSVVILSSVQTLRMRGHFDTYLEKIDPAHRATIVATSAPLWLPIATAMAHYGACDQLGLDADEIQTIGSSVGSRINSTFLKALAEGVRLAGVTPWTLLGHFRGVWGRLLQNGSIGVGRAGARECVVEVRGLPLVQFEYFRLGFAGVVARGIEFGGGHAANVKVATFDGAKGELTFEGTWT